MIDTVLILPRRQALEYHRCDRRLVELLDDGLRVWPKPRMYAGDIWRSVQENAEAGAATQMHVVEPESGLRSFDARSHNLAKTINERWAACQLVARAVNRLWIYDPRRPAMVVAYAGKHGTGPHVHFQVHQRTRRRRRG